MRDFIKNYYREYNEDSRYKKQGERGGVEGVSDKGDNSMCRRKKEKWNSIGISSEFYKLIV